MTITEKVATLYHTARGLIKMKFSFKRAKFKQDDYLVQTHMRMIITEVETLEQVPNFGNLREMVSLAVEEFKRKEAELKAIEEAAKEVVAPVSEQPKVEEAPKDVVTPTPTVTEVPKETTERKEEHAE
nr:MAG TPA: hypothetical protein [Caudoviricetes sp.]